MKPIDKPLELIATRANSACLGRAIIKTPIPATRLGRVDLPRKALLPDYLQSVEEILSDLKSLEIIVNRTACEDLKLNNQMRCKFCGVLAYDPGNEKSFIRACRSCKPIALLWGFMVLVGFPAALTLLCLIM